MTFISKCLLMLSFFLIVFNGSPVGYILFHERLGSFYGDSMFVVTSLLGVLLASIAEDGKTDGPFYYKVCMYRNLIICFYPIYWHVLSTQLF